MACQIFKEKYLYNIKKFNYLRLNPFCCITNETELQTINKCELVIILKRSRSFVHSTLFSIL